MIALDEVQRLAVLYLARDVIARRRLNGQSVPKEILDLQRHLIAASADGTETVDEDPELGHDDLIDSNAAASMLGCSRRWVTEIRADLDACKVAGRWVFRRSVVAEYAESRQSAHDAAPVA